MNEKQIDRFLRRQFSTVGWALVFYNVLLTGLVYAVLAQDALSQFIRNTWVDYDAVYGNAWGYLAAIAVGIVILHSWKGPGYWRQEVLVREKPMHLGAFAAFITLTIGAQMVSSLWISLVEAIMNGFGGSIMPMLEGISGASETFSMFLYGAIVGPVAEEVLFRGFVLRSLRPYGKRFAIVLSSLLFAFFHGNLLQLPYAFIMGLVMGYVAAEYSIYWALAVHMFNNLVLADLYPRLTAGLSDAAYYTLDTILFGGFAVGAVVLLMVNRKKVRAYREENWMDRRCLKCFFTNSGILVLLAMLIVSMAELFFL